MATVLVTGASGFLGGHIVETFLEAGYRVACAVSETSQTWRLDEFVDRLNVSKWITRMQRNGRGWSCSSA